jgi:hypothetical protein
MVEILVTRAAERVPAGALGAQYLDARSLISTWGIGLHLAQRQRTGVCTGRPPAAPPGLTMPAA